MSPEAIPQLDQLPLLSARNALIAQNLDPNKIASEWFREFTSSVESANVDKTLSLLVEDAYWRDILSLTWEYRTINGSADLRQFLEARLADAKLSKFVLESVDFIQTDQGWIQGLFAFEIGGHGGGTGVFRIVPTPTGEWKGINVFTNLESLKNFPEKIGRHREPHPIRGKWGEKRRKEQEFEGVDPHVIIIGGGHCGLQIAARLKCLDVPTLVVESDDRLGNRWRTRYDTLCLNVPVCAF
jgi:hypothetical protein